MLGIKPRSVLDWPYARLTPYRCAIIPVPTLYFFTILRSSSFCPQRWISSGGGGVTTPGHLPHPYSQSTSCREPEFPAHSWCLSSSSVSWLLERAAASRVGGRVGWGSNMSPALFSHSGPASPLIVLQSEHLQYRVQEQPPEAPACTSSFVPLSPHVQLPSLHLFHPLSCFLSFFPVPPCLYLPCPL